MAIPAIDTDNAVGASGGRPINRFPSRSTGVVKSRAERPRWSLPSAPGLPEQRMLQSRPKDTENSWTEQDNRDQLTHDGGLTKPLHQLAQYSACRQKYNDLRDEHRQRGAVRPGIGGREC
jgi:hypothetical protein